MIKAPPSQGSRRIDNVIDTGLTGPVAPSCIATLGPSGTSSEWAAAQLADHLGAMTGTTVRVRLFDQYEDAVRAILSGDASHALIANAYAGIHTSYMDTRLRLGGAFVLDTPDYGLAMRPNEVIPPRCRIITHPAPEPLIWQLLPAGSQVEEVLTASSTSAAAAAVREQRADLALTTVPAASKYGLNFISKLRPIRMLWSVFVRKTDVDDDALAVRGAGGTVTAPPGSRTITTSTRVITPRGSSGTPASGWTPTSWRGLPTAQQPDWPDHRALEEVLSQLARQPPLVRPCEVDDLQHQLADAAAGRRFILQAGDCAESFDAFSEALVRSQLRIILQMALILTHSSGLPVVKIGRIAGQFAKPRSSPTERIGTTELPSFRGDAVNSREPTPPARRPDPQRLLAAYRQAAVTLNFLRVLDEGDDADLEQLCEWDGDLLSRLEPRHRARAAEIERAMRLFSAVRLPPGQPRVQLYTSHEALLLEFEAALTRQAPRTGQWYGTSGHHLWVGDRTRQLDGAHVRFAAGLANPVAVKLGPSATPEEVVQLCEVINPDRVPGRLTLVTRLGAGRIEQLLPELVKAVWAADHPVIWVCDPMHGNTFAARSGHKTRRFDDIMAELRAFFAVHRRLGTYPGGLHLECTGEQVTECLGGPDGIDDARLLTRYETPCDPRLSAAQSLACAFEVAELLARRG